MPALGKGFGISFSVWIRICVSMLQIPVYLATSSFLASLLLTRQSQTCINASTGLFTVYTFYHSRVIILLAYNLKMVTVWANHIFQWLWYLTSTSMRSQRNMQNLYQRSQMGTSASCQGSIYVSHKRLPAQNVIF